MTGYVRQSSSEIVTGATIEAADLNDEYNQLQSAFDASTGHSHSGATGEGAPLTRASLNGFGANTGIVVVNATATFAARTLTGTANEITVTNGDGVSGNPTFSLPSALTFTGKTVTGGTFSGITISGVSSIPWSSITSTPTTLSGYGITDAQPLDADLTAVAGLATTGLIARTGAGTATTRTVTGTANEITVTNGDGVAGNPTLSLPAALTFTGKTITGGTFVGISIPWSSITSTPTTLSGYGITDAVPSSRTLTAGTGIAAIGDLSVNRTIAIDTAVVARYTAAQTWTAVQVPLTAALTDGATVNWVGSSAQVATVTCTAARTFAAPSALTANAWYALIITNSGGAWNHSFNAVFIWDTNEGIPTGIPSGGKGIFTFWSDGTNLREASRRILAS
jgi:hypothetical protein